MPKMKSNDDHQYPHIIELAGVAGAGKSSLLKAMMQRNGKIRSFPVPPKTVYLPFLLKMYSTWLPLFLGKFRGSRWFTWQEIRNMAYLETWLSFIRSKSRGEEYYVLDPGFVHWLASLDRFGPEITKHVQYRRWWKDKYEQWSQVADAIIWMDAPEELCLQRVLSRDEWHELKDVPREDALSELKGYRESYGKIVPEIESKYPNKVLYFRSDQTSTEQIAAQLFSDTGLWNE